ncbi:barstar family protein [Clostridium cellulovorans]|uniref:Barstar (Barnase inhibitor) n=1 Tax=Clostridium cellulovorans (strain ATCC 35296 / DSM 3052 / OCM 3 / 743B) TaxID=573061 RepID=D9SN76_CLOC7|nr:barstar family protein [Clostridium cellulovorans]ADL53868.1 Barstar (barnase inhibitor) [Clostridium cellulovorans 743B]
MNNIVILDGSQFTSKERLHDILKSELALPDYYGNNLDALWDCLTGYIKLPISVEWTNFKQSKELLGDYAEATLNIFLAASNSLKEDFCINVH